MMAATSMYALNSMLPCMLRSERRVPSRIKMAAANSLVTLNISDAPTYESTGATPALPTPSPTPTQPAVIELPSMPTPSVKKPADIHSSLRLLVT